MKPRSVLLLLCTGSFVAHAAVEPAAARKLLGPYESSVVTVSAVLKVRTLVNGSAMGNEREVPATLPGTLITPEGWVVVSGFQLNPLATLMPKPFKTERNGQAIEVEVKARVENLRFRLRNETEVAARVLAEEDDLGLTLLAPDPKPTDTLPRFDPAPAAEYAEAGPFTQYLTVRAATEAFKHAPLMDAGVIGAVLEKPRHLFLEDYGHQVAFLGSPFIDLAGRLIGFGAMSLRAPENPSAGGMESWPVAVIVPASDVHDWVRRIQKAADSPPAKTAAKASTDRLADPAVARAAAVQNIGSGAVVIIEGSVKYNCGRCANEHEAEVQCVGTVLDASGLVVTASDGRGAGSKYLQQNLRFVLADRTEVPAQIILEDDDLELTVLEPVPSKDKGAPPTQLKALSLTDDADAAVFDEVVTLGRLDRTRRYGAAVSVGRIVTRIDQPRPFMKINAPIAGPHDHGRPVFLPDGRLLGVLAPEPEESTPSGPDALQGVSFREHNPARVVRVAALRELIEQARKARTKQTDPLPPGTPLKP